MKVYLQKPKRKDYAYYWWAFSYLIQYCCTCSHLLLPSAYLFQPLLGWFFKCTIRFTTSSCLRKRTHTHTIYKNTHTHTHKHTCTHTQASELFTSFQQCPVNNATKCDDVEIVCTSLNKERFLLQTYISWYPFCECTCKVVAKVREKPIVGERKRENERVAFK